MLVGKALLLGSQPWSRKAGGMPRGSLMQGFLIELGMLMDLGPPRVMYIRLPRLCPAWLAGQRPITCPLNRRRPCPGMPC